MYRQVGAVQEVCGKDTSGCLGAQWGQNGGFLSPLSSHGEVQPVHTVQPRLRLRCEVEGIHGRQDMVQDAGRAQHLTVEVINQSQQAPGLHPQKRLTGGALEKVLETSTLSPTEVLFLTHGVRLEIRLQRGSRLWRVTKRRNWGE